MFEEDFSARIRLYTLASTSKINPAKVSPQILNDEKIRNKSNFDETINVISHEPVEHSAEHNNSTVLSDIQQRLEKIAVIGATVKTPYGQGIVDSIDPTSLTPFKIRMQGWPATAYLSENCVRRKKKLFEMSDIDKRSESLEHRINGKMRFNIGDYSYAILEFELALLYLRQLKNAENHDCEEIIRLYQNVASCKIKSGEFAHAVNAANDALSLAPLSVKALFLRARANRLRGKLDEAKLDLNELLRIEPASIDAKKELSVLTQEILDKANARKKMFSGIFTSESIKRPPSQQAMKDALHKKSKIENTDNNFVEESIHDDKESKIKNSVEESNNDEHDVTKRVENVVRFANNDSKSANGKYLSGIGSSIPPNSSSKTIEKVALFAVGLGVVTLACSFFILARRR